MDILSLCSQAAGNGHASDIFLVPGARAACKINGEVTPLGGEVLTPEDTGALVRQIYAMAGHRDMERLMDTGDDDFSFSLAGVGRFRCNAFRQRGSLAMVLRIMDFGIPDPETLHIPPEVLRLAEYRKGMVLVTGAAGSGKSTTLACMVDRINRLYRDHIITIEDPIEYIHRHGSSIVTQREVEHDTRDYASAVRAALRQAPDVILLGEMRDLETIQTAITAAETGQLLLSSLHTVGAVKTVDRILDVFPSAQQQQVRVQLSMTLRAIVSQQLIPTLDGGREPAFEIMIANSAIQNMIREGKTPQMDNVIRSGAGEGMRSMNDDILRLYRAGRISRDNALRFSPAPELLARRLEEVRP